MNIIGINYESIADAEGISCVIFVAGCLNHCEGCHNPESWDFNVGKPVTDELINNIRQEINKRPFISNLVLSGGDPMFSAKDCVEFLEKLNLDLPIWVYSGLTYDKILQDNSMCNLLDKCDVLVDGPFIKELRDITLKFRGSSNQNIYHKIDGIWLKEDV